MTYIYGIGHTRSGEILAQAGIESDIRVKDLTEEQVSKISRTLDAAGGVEGDSRFFFTDVSRFDVVAARFLGGNLPSPHLADL